ncbi:hypothetical protein MMC26_004512 [Xylographa opegraphella]|nr:hypothetical protein [Xylographa opegraphella]
MPLSSFHHAQVSICAEWKTLFDQGGLCIILPQNDGKSKWIKTGIEFYNGAPNVSTVACDRWADWSLTPLPDGDQKGVTIGMERELLDGKASSVLVVYIVEGNVKRNVREITWVFEDTGENERECWVGVLVGKPTKDTDDEEANLEVQFKGLEIEVF